MMVHWSGGNRFDRSLGWVEIEGLRSCETWVFHKSGWVFHKFTENGEFYIAWFHALTGKIETPALTKASFYWQVVFLKFKMISRWHLHLEQSEWKSITKKRRSSCCKVLFWRNATNAVSKRQNIWPCTDTRESIILCWGKSAQSVNTRIFTQTELGSITNKFTWEWKGQNWVEIVEGSGVNIWDQKMRGITWTFTLHVQGM